MGLGGSFLPTGSRAIPIHVNATLQSSVLCSVSISSLFTSPANLHNLSDGQQDVCSRSLEIGQNVEKTWSLETPSIALESRDLNTDKGFSPLWERNSKHIFEMYRQKGIFLKGYRHPSSRERKRRLNSNCGLFFAISFLSNRKLIVKY